MNMMTNFPTTTTTMTSTEIAEITGKSKSHVHRDIASMLKQLDPNMDDIDFKGVFVEKDGLGESSSIT